MELRKLSLTTIAARRRALLGRLMTRAQLHCSLTSYSEQMHREVEFFLSSYVFGSILFSQVIALSWRSNDSVVGIISSRAVDDKRLKYLL